MKDQAELESKVQEWLEEIKPVPPRNPHAAARGRAQFLGQAVSASEFRRHKGWNSIFRKERFAMNMIVSILVIAGLLFSGGATVNAARNDLPNEPLYALKLWSEDVGLQLQNNPDQKVERLMELAQVRMQEMTKLANTGQAVPDQLQQRLQLHIQQALQICATQDDPAMDRTLLQIRDRLQQQDRDMEQLQLHAAQDVQPILQQTRTMLQQHLQLVDEGLLNHEMFRYAARNGFQFGQEEIVPPVQNGPGPQGGQPTDVPAGPNTNPGGPNTDPSGPGYGTGEPDPDPRGPNTDPGGPNTGATPSSPTGGGGAGGNNGGGSGSGGGGTGGSGSGSGSGSGGSGSTGGSGGGSGSGGSTGGGGSGGN